MRISIIGAGKVAWQLAQALENAGHCIEEIWSRNPANAAALVDHLYDARVQEGLDFSHSQARVFLLALKDSAVGEVAAQLMLPAGAVVAHTSGSLPMSVLAPACEQYGVFYPLQTFSKGRKLSFEELPFCLEAVDKKTFSQLKKLASSLSRRVYQIGAAEREKLHLAAVFACNFTNHLFRISEDILKAQDLDPQILHPLIAETVEKSLEIGAESSQTGPAVRQDREVMAFHLEQLEEQPEWAELYYLLSQDIIRGHTAREQEM